MKKAVIEILRGGKWVVLATYESIAAATRALMRIAQKDDYEHQNYQIREEENDADSDNKSNKK